MSFFDFDKGLDVTRAAIALGRAGRFAADATEFANERFGRNSVPAAIVRAAIGMTTPGSPDWGDDAVATAVAEFIELVEQRSVAGRLPLRHVPLETRMVMQSDGAVAGWVGEGEAIPAGEFDLGTGAMLAMKLAVLCVVSTELLALSSVGAERIVRNELVRSVAAALDAAFLDPANTGTPGVKPASITAAAPSVTAGGDLQAGLAQAAELFTGDLERAWWVGRPATFAAMAGADHPNIGLRGGELLGAPAIAASALPLTETSPPVGDLILLDPDGIAFAGEGLEIGSSREAAVSLDGVTLTDTWANNLATIRVIRPTNWQVAREGAVVLIRGVTA